jgi:hypothetical protein
MKKHFPYLSLMVLQDWYLEELKKHNDYKPFGKDTMFIYLGEIPNMLGHCVIIGFQSGKIYPGYHIENLQLKNEED